MDVASAKTTLFKDLGATQCAALFVGLLYITGYYITSIFVRNYGIPESELFRLEYIKIGLVFWLIAAGMVLIPFGSFYLTFRVRRTSGLPHFVAGWIGTSLNTSVMLGVPLALSFFATRYEWYFHLPQPMLGCRTVNTAVGWALALLTFAVIVLPCLERLVVKTYDGARRAWLFRLVIEPLRFGALFVSSYLIAGAVLQIPWVGTVFGRAGSFVAVSMVFIGGITAAIAWMKHIEKVRGSAIVLLLIAFGVCFFYYLALTSYVFGVYSAIPANRGGRMPVTKAFIEAPGHESLIREDCAVGTVKLRGPIYIIEQTDSRIYFAQEEMDHWFEKFVPVHTLSRDSVPYMRYERIEDGFPRVPR